MNKGLNAFDDKKKREQRRKNRLEKDRKYISKKKESNEDQD